MLILLLVWLGNICCRHSENRSKSNHWSLPAADTVHTLSAAHPSFRQRLEQTDEVRKKKFVRITAREIINPVLVPVSFDLYRISRGKTEFLGSVAPYPADNPGSFIIATSGRLATGDVLELRLTFPEDWNKKDRLEVKITWLAFE